MMPAKKDTQTLVNEISGRIQDLYQGNEDQVASALSLVMLKILNSKYKPDLSEGNIELIRANYPKATGKDIQERSLNNEGLASLLSVFQVTAQIAIDYCPLTNNQEYLDIDLSPNTKSILAQEFAEEAYSKMRKIGFSPYGSASTMIFLGAATAQAEGVSVFKIVRPIIEALYKAFENQSLNVKFAEEDAINAISLQLGISRKAAMKYLENYKQLKAMGKL